MFYLCRRLWRRPPRVRAMIGMLAKGLRPGRDAPRSGPARLPPGTTRAGGRLVGSALAATRGKAGQRQRAQQQRGCSGGSYDS